MKTLTSRAYLPALVLLAFACLPVATRADTFTLEGAPIDSFSFSTALTLSGATIKTVTVVMASTDAAAYLTDVRMGTKIDLLTLDEFITVDGTTTENALEFAHDVAIKDTSTPGSDMGNVTFSYEQFKIAEDVGGSSGNGNGNGGNGNGVPEPSSAALLASGLIGLAGLGRKKLFNHGGKR
jgi:hypothetical protein